MSQCSLIVTAIMYGSHVLNALLGYPLCMHILHVCIYVCNGVTLLLLIVSCMQVPRVFIGGECIGGCDETVALYERGKLVPRLKELGAINF